MNIYYLGRRARRASAPQVHLGDAIELIADNWNDFGFVTTFATVCRRSDKSIELGPIRLLINDVPNSSKHLDKLLESGWSGEFPIPNTDYVSVPSEITFYEQLIGELGQSEAVRLAKEFRDASYLVHTRDDEKAKALVKSLGFKDSLQRERGSVKAFYDVWKVLERQSVAVLDLGFQFDNVFGEKSTLNLKFQTQSRLPSDINVLIGPNGVGKSQILHQMVRDWLDEDKAEDSGFVSKPNLSQVVVVSYSPFERFPIDSDKYDLKDREVYRYFGFRGKDTNDKVRLSHNYSKRDAANALLSCAADDIRFRQIDSWGRKVHTVETILRTAFEFDFAAVTISEVESARKGAVDIASDNEDIALPELPDGQRYVSISSDEAAELNIKLLRKHLLPFKGVTFFKENEIVHLSSGQRLFAYIVINVLGSIRRNSLLLVDEPELFLHPTLEIQFIGMLKSVLRAFNSKALMATHSLVTVREIPAECVHVLERTEDELIIKNPPFQTFGGDVQRISSYVFGDNSVSKPFESWIKDQIEELGSGEALIQLLGTEINEELIVQIRSMERGLW